MTAGRRFRGKARALARAESLSFTEVMASLVSSGLTVQGALEVFASVSTGKRPLSLARSVLASVRSGTSFHDAMRPFARGFPPLYLPLVRIGEKTGSVAEILRALSAYIRAVDSAREKAKSALAYPLFVLAVAAFGSLAIAVYVEPLMGELLAPLGAGVTEATGGAFLTPATHGATGASLPSAAWSRALLLLVPAAAGFAAFRRGIGRFRAAIDRTLLRLPVIGCFIARFETLSFSFAMELLLKGGYTLADAMREAVCCARNAEFSRALETALDKVERGETLSRAFLASRDIPPYVGMWVGVAERTGGVESAFSQIRAHFQSRLEVEAGKLVGIVEPLAILVVGIIVLFAVLRFVVPILTMYGRAL